jgi:hypothetical protein
MRMGFFALLIIGVSFADVVYAQQEPDQALRVATYQSEKREPALAGLLSALVPSLGHVYAGETTTGIVFLAAECIEAVVAGLTLSALLDTTKYWTSSDLDFLYTVGITCAVALPLTKIWECGDAIAATNRHNHALKKRLCIRLGALGNDRGAVCGLAWKF